MDYADKCLIQSMADEISKKNDIVILCQFAFFKGKNTALICVNGKGDFFTSYELCKKYLNELSNEITS